MLYMQEVRLFLQERGYTEQDFSALYGSYYGFLWYSFLNLLLYVFCYKLDFFADQKIPRPERLSKPYPTKQVAKMWGLVLFNLTVVSPIITWLSYPIFKNAGVDYEATFSSLYATTPLLELIPKVIFWLLVDMIAEDTAFYWCHRAIHHRSVYKYVHKIHHEFKAVNGFAAVYAHPLEFVVGNLVPLTIGTSLTGQPFCVFMLWTTIRLWETVDTHSGYEFKWSPFHLFPAVQGGPSRHDFHHSQNTGSYGTFFTFWDWICGTDKPFQDYVARQGWKSSRTD
eukprot:m.166578 g.166578  ORF g.166578 m.166578 type:complete len:282 (-) comp14443_c0_seq1:200-1045(-)